jgi:hypothetical protein
VAVGKTQPFNTKLVAPIREAARRKGRSKRTKLIPELKIATISVLPAILDVMKITEIKTVIGVSRLLRYNP